MPKPTILPSFEYLNDCLDYCPETGILTWKHRPREHFSCGTVHRCFISRWAGKPAGFRSPYGYMKIKISPQSFPSHRIAWFLYYGREPDEFIDHINGRKDDNRIINLRDVSLSANSHNKSLYRSNTSGILGIDVHKKTGKWRAQIVGNGKKYYLGLYDDIADAISAREKASRDFGFSANHGQENPNSPVQPILKPSPNQ